MPTHATGNLADDARIAEVVDAEERVLRFLRGEFGQRAVKDCRARHKGYDFLVDDGLGQGDRKVDVKADLYAETTKRLAWEVAIRRPDRTKKPGWGLLALDWVVVVGPRGEDRLWHAHICSAARWREYVERNVTREGESPASWHRFDMPNRDGTAGLGWAIPIEELRRAGVMFREELL